VAGCVSAAVVFREQLDILVVLAPVDLVLDAVVREVDLAVEVRQVVLARPRADLVLVAVWAPSLSDRPRLCSWRNSWNSRFRSWSSTTRRTSSPSCSSRSRASSWRYVA
jgi:hypothetical protein